ncbi:unnamed protein product [Lampetra planeri]
MKRPDFPSGHDGCQAVEAIPQEASAGNAHLSVASDVEGHGRMRMPVVPKRPGKLTLIASLDCTELPQVHGGATFQCEP